MELAELTDVWHERYDAAAGLYAATTGMEIRVGIALNKPSVKRSDTRDTVLGVTWLLTGGGTFYERLGDGQELTRPLRDGSLIIRRPGTISRIIMDANLVQRRCFIDVNPQLLPLLESALPRFAKLPAVLEAPYNAALLDLFIEYIKSIAVTDSVQPVTFIEALSAILSALLRINHESAQGANCQMNNAARLLAMEPASVTLPDIAEKCGMPYSIFRKRFIEAYGQTPGKWRIIRRIERAKQELAAGESIIDVAAHLMYSDVYSFTHQFRSVAGITPKQYQLRNIL